MDAHGNLPALNVEDRLSLRRAASPEPWPVLIVYKLVYLTLSTQ